MGSLSLRFAALVALIPSLAAAQTVRGRVLDAVDHQPIVAAKIELRDSTGKVLRQLLSSPSGAFAFLVPGPGEYQVRIASIGYLEQPAMVITVPPTGFALEDVALYRTQRNAVNRTMAMPAGSVRSDRLVVLPPITALGRLTYEKIAHMHRMWDQVTGAPIAVVVYDIKFSELTMHGTGESRTAHVDLHLRQEVTSGGRSRDTTTKIDLVVPASLGRQPEYKGFFIAGSMDGVTAWTLIATQPEHQGGADWENNRPPLGSGPLVVSDIVIGARNPELTWVRNEVRVLLAPFDDMERPDTVGLYYQVKSTRDVAKAHSTIALFHDEEVPARAKAVMMIERDDSLKTGVNDVQSGLDVRTLSRGRYRLVVTVVDPATNSTATQVVLMQLN